jgi:hypothetical protein
MSRTTTALLFGSIFALMSAGALAEDHPGTKEAGKEYGAGVGMMNLDTDKDERISKDEYSAHVDKRFESADKNKDGYLDEDESNTIWKGSDIDGPYYY